MRWLRASVLVAATLLLVSPIPAASNPAAQGTRHLHRVWLKHTVLEQFDVTATETYLRVFYGQGRNAQLGNYVDDPRHSKGWCYHSAWPGWQNPICQHIGPNTISPWELKHELEAWFWNPDCCDYRHKNVIQVYGDNTYKTTCKIVQGELPWFWESKCKGGRLSP